MTVWNFRNTLRWGGNSRFSISRSCVLKTYCLSSIKLSLPIQESVCSVVIKYFYNSAHVFYCKLQSDNAWWKTFVWPKMVCIRAKIGLNRQLDRRQRGNYFKPWNVNFFNAKLDYNLIQNNYCSVLDVNVILQGNLNKSKISIWVPIKCLVIYDATNIFLSNC